MAEERKFFGSATSGTQKPLTTPKEVIPTPTGTGSTISYTGGGAKASSPTIFKEAIPTPPKESPPMDQETIFKGSIPKLIEIIETLNPPEKVKIIGKLRGALELFNFTN